MRISVTGHMDVSDDSIELIRTEIRNQLKGLKDVGPVTGVSCLARGSDSIFAEAILESGGTLEVVLPSPNYREKKVKEDHAPLFDRLIAEAHRIRTLPFDEVNKDAYEAANRVLLSECDRLFAVWDGQAGQRSGTATVVDEARTKNVHVTTIWPDGARRQKVE